MRAAPRRLPEQTGRRKEIVPMNFEPRTGSHRSNHTPIHHHARKHGTSTYVRGSVARCSRDSRDSRDPTDSRPSPPSTRSSSFSIPLRRRTRTQEESPCPWCNGTATLPCTDCEGTGRRIAQRNHHAKNHVNVARVVGTKWTSLDRTFGWRHFECKELHVLTSDAENKKKRTYCLLEATCDPTARLWVELEILKSRRIWAAGWLQRDTLRSILDEMAAEGEGDPCDTCHGEKTVPCRYCCSLEPISLS